MKYRSILISFRKWVELVKFSQCYTINIFILSLIRYVCSYYRNIFLENMFVTRTKNYCLELQNTKNEFILFDDVSFCHVFSLYIHHIHKWWLAIIPHENINKKNHWFKHVYLILYLQFLISNVAACPQNQQRKAI